MQNKPGTKHWNEVEMLLSAVSISLTLGLWNLFASPKNPSNASAAQQTDTPTSQPEPSAVVSITPAALPTNSLTLLPGQVLLLGGASPLSASATPTAGLTSTSSTAVVRRSGGGGKGGGGGGGGGGGAKTHSSHH